MKKMFLMMAAAALVFAGCTEKPVDENPPAKDSISVNPGSKKFTNIGGEIPVVVTSSGTWAISGGQSWATPSDTSGESGDTVLFTVNPNNTENTLEAVFTFKCGEAEDTFTIEVAGKEPTKTKLDLVGDASVRHGNLKGNVEIKVDTEVVYRELDQKVTILSGEGDWITYKTKTLGTDNLVSVFFELVANTSFEERKAEIEITGGEDGKVVVTVTQDQTDRLVVEENRLILEQEGGTATVKLTTNVEYEVVVEYGGEGEKWLTMGTATTDSEGVISIPFTAEGLAAGKPSRAAQVTISQKEGDLTQSVSISQKGATLIDVTANMNKNWAWVPTWANNAPLRNLADFTFEALVNANTFTKTIASHGSASKLNTIGGIEGGKFMLRFGDDPIDANQLQVIYPNGTNDGDKKTGNAKYATGEWIHLAVTFHTSSTPRFGKVYVNGEEVPEMAATTPTMSRTVDFGLQIDGAEQGWGKPRRFWIGYAWDENRFFDALFSEVRIWNKALTEAEIKAPNHFYSVEPNADGLVAYWKFNDNVAGTSGVIKDHTSNKNDMSTNIGVTWAPVALP